MTGFLDQLYSNHAISMITMDITVAASSFLVYLIYQFSNKKIRAKCFIKYILSLFIVGFSLSLPLYLYDNYKKWKILLKNIIYYNNINYICWNLIHKWKEQ